MLFYCLVSNVFYGKFSEILRTKNWEIELWYHHRPPDSMVNGKLSNHLPFIYSIKMITVIKKASSFSHSLLNECFVYKYYIYTGAVYDMLLTHIGAHYTNSLTNSQRTFDRRSSHRSNVLHSYSWMLEWSKQNYNYGTCTVQMYMKLAEPTKLLWHIVQMWMHFFSHSTK